MQNYWCPFSVLPKRILKEIDAMLRAFLWSGVELNSKRAKVRWSQVCVPKSEGGLGFKSCMLQHLWALCKKQDSLWVRWIHSYIIKDGNFWYLKIPNDASWTMRKILNLQKLGQDLIKHVTGNR